jgi:hypothetical protein
MDCFLRAVGVASLSMFLRLVRLVGVVLRKRMGLVHLVHLVRLVHLARRVYLASMHQK